jgi:hypothetical protein
MTLWSSNRQWWALIFLVWVAARGTLHVVTHALPLANDDAIPMIQAHLLLKAEPTTTLINQPYNGTLDSWLIAPLLALFGAHLAFRLYELLCGIALVAVCAGLAGKAGGERAARPAALLAAFGTPYMVLMTAVGPVPNFLIPVAVGVVLGLMWDPGPRGPAWPRGLAAGLVGGLAAWDSALALPAMAGALGGLLLARLPVAKSPAFLVGLGVGWSPTLLARAIGAAGHSSVTALRPRWLWAEGLEGLARAASGLFGLSVPLVVDGPERVALPLAAAVALAVALVVLVAAGVRRTSVPLVGWAAALAFAFAFSRRTGPNEVRYLYGLTVPVLALMAVGFERIRSSRRAAAAVLLLPILLAWGAGHAIVARAWRDPRHAADTWEVPPLGPALARLRALEIGSTYASLQFAGRLAVESDFGIVVSQAWNERIPGDPLRFRDEVDLDPRAVWVLSPRFSRGMPRAAGFRALLGDLGGRWREETAGDVVVFHGFEPPFDERRPVPAAEMVVSDANGERLPPSVLDRDTQTAWRAPIGIVPGSGLSVRLAAPRRLSALVLAVDLVDSPLAVPWVATVDGEIVARGPHRYALQWVGGVPRAAKQALLTIVLPDRRASEVKLLFQGAGVPLVVSEVFAYGPEEKVVSPAGEAAAAQALAAAREGRWTDAVARYEEAVRGEPDRAGYHACLVRARWRAGHRQHLDVESLDDGGEALVSVKP